MGRDALKIATLLSAAVLAAFGASVSAAHAQGYPNRVITMIVPYAPGGPGDTAARSIVDKMSAVLGQQIVIENVAGAGGMTGATRVARAEPDGYTLLIHQTGLAIGPALYPNLGFNVEKDLTAVGMVNTSYSYLALRNGIPAKNLNELIAWMKGPGKPAKFAHPGAGTLAHLQSVLFAKAFDLDVNLIPYRGGALAMNDVIAEHVDMVWAAPTTSAELIKNGKIKSVVYGAPKPYPSIPEIPGIAELGYPNLAIPFWHAMWVPAATPPAIIQKLNAALRETVADPQVMKAYGARGLEAFPPDQMSPDYANAFTRQELQRWEKVVKENNIQAQ
jgi:tripartite-type tricarboxylate transporter receptor subunit TctC